VTCGEAAYIHRLKLAFIFHSPTRMIFRLDRSKIFSVEKENLAGKLNRRARCKQNEAKRRYVWGALSKKRMARKVQNFQKIISVLSEIVVKLKSPSISLCAKLARRARLQ
jgi:hypothetical protein